MLHYRELDGAGSKPARWGTTGFDPNIVFGLRTPRLDMLSCVEPHPTGNRSGCRFFVLQAVLRLLAC